MFSQGPPLFQEASPQVQTHEHRAEKTEEPGEPQQGRGDLVWFPHRELPWLAFLAHVKIAQMSAPALFSSFHLLNSCPHFEHLTHHNHFPRLSFPSPTIAHFHFFQW